MSEHNTWTIPEPKADYIILSEEEYNRRLGELEELRAELARLREQVQWEPLPDGNYDGLEVSANGSEIGLSTHDVHGIQWPVDHWLSDDIRLCRRKTDALPQPVEREGWCDNCGDTIMVDEVCDSCGKPAADEAAQPDA
jgi:ribosomal protein L32